MYMQQKTDSVTDGFYNLGIAPAISVVLTKLRFYEPTPIQKQAIPIAIQGKDVVGIAQTGTGKTLAFGIPMIQRLLQTKKQGLVLVPTRELALQVEESLYKICRIVGLRTVVLIGGTSLWPQIQALRNKPHIIIGTPGRIIDHLEQKNMQLSGVDLVVLDEADRMLDMGFMPQIQRIFKSLPRERQMMLFSATMPPEIMKIAETYMQLPIRIEIAPAGTTADKVTQEIFIVARDQKENLLSKVLETHQTSTLIFVRTKYGAKKMTLFIRSLGMCVAEIHSDRSLSQRREALQGFKYGKYNILVATDIASRGIDVVGIGLVLNYDLPATSDDYIHRIGRTARAGAGGHAITFATPQEGREIRAIERLIHQSLPIGKLDQYPSLSLTTFMQPERRSPRSSRYPSSSRPSAWHNRNIHRSPRTR